MSKTADILIQCNNEVHNIPGFLSRHQKDLQYILNETNFNIGI